MYCNLCGHDDDKGTVGFKSICQGCGEYLHSCVQCSLYDPKAERCRSLTTEAISDRAGNNYCEEYVPNTDPEGNSRSSGGRGAKDFDALFDED